MNTTPALIAKLPPLPLLPPLPPPRRGRKLPITGWTLVAWSKAITVASALVLIAGCDAKVQIESRPSAEPSKLARAFHRYPLSDTNAWLPIFEIWKCDDGTFEIKTVSGPKGKFQTLQEAEEYRYKCALLDAGVFAVPSDRGQDCGMRIK